MKGLQLTYSPYTLKLNKSFFTARTEIKERRGFILRLTDQDGFEGIGDCCPFPEIGSESIEDVENVLSDFKLKVIIDDTEIEKSINNCLVNYTQGSTHPSDAASNSCSGLDYTQEVRR